MSLPQTELEAKETTTLGSNGGMLMVFEPVGARSVVSTPGGLSSEGRARD